MKRTLLVLSWLFAGGLCVKADTVKKHFKVKRKAVSGKNMSIKPLNISGQLIEGDELGIGAVMDQTLLVTSESVVFGDVVVGDELSTASKFTLTDTFSATDTVTIDRALIVGDELAVAGTVIEHESGSKVYLQQVARNIVVGDELGIIDEITRHDAADYEQDMRTVEK